MNTYKKHKSNNSKGFTVLELAIVITIMALLAAISISGYDAYLTSTQLSATSTVLRTSTYQLEHMALTEGGATATLKNDVLTIQSKTQTVTHHISDDVSVSLNGQSFTCLSVSSQGFPTTNSGCNAIYFGGSNNAALYDWTAEITGTTHFTQESI